VNGYKITAIIVCPDPEFGEAEREVQWLIESGSVTHACRTLIHRLAEKGCRVHYYTSIQPRELKGGV